MTLYLFVYGTLRRAAGHPMHHVLARSSTFAGEGVVGARMFDLGSYPGIVLSDRPGDRVVGDVFDLAADAAGPLLRSLDGYEGIRPEHSTPQEYTRRVVDVQLTDERTIRAWAYVLTDPAPAHPRIPAWPRTALVGAGSGAFPESLLEQAEVRYPPDRTWK